MSDPMTQQEGSAMSTTADYDARRVTEIDAGDRSPLGEIVPSLPKLSTVVVDEDPNDVPFFELPGADLSGEELTVAVVPKRADEFMCSCCFLVQHRSRLRSTSGGRQICADCV
ncbi:DUF4193 domain-containing protein [Mycobacterium intermedium]